MCAVLILSTLQLVRNSKRIVILVCTHMRTLPFCIPQRIESVWIIFCHILDAVLTLNLSSVCVQTVRFQDFGLSMALPKHDRL